MITLPDYDVLTYEPPENVYGILAAPPCTEFSIGKGSRPRDFCTAIKIVGACFEIIWKCRDSGHLKFWALENPVGLLRQFIGVPKYQFYQWQFGELQYKYTDLWGYFNPPKATTKKIPSELQAIRGEHGIHWSNPKCPPEYEHLNLGRAALRAITPPGFAQAFFKANQ